MQLIHHDAATLALEEPVDVAYFSLSYSALPDRDSEAIRRDGHATAAAVRGQCEPCLYRRQSPRPASLAGRQASPFLLGPHKVWAVSEDAAVSIVAYDAAWPARFEEERAALVAAIGGWIVGGVHHVGSTAVPGLEAKPIIDILVGVEGLEGARSTFDPLAVLGYRYAPYRPDEMHWFCKPHPIHRTHHLHLVPVAAPRFREELTFRNYLRSHPEVAKEYGMLKATLAEQFKYDRGAYTAAKAPFIRSIVARGGC